MVKVVAYLRAGISDRVAEAEYQVVLWRDIIN